MAVLLIAFAIAFSVVAVRLFTLQVVQSSDLSSSAEARRTNVVTLQAKRGTIYDRNGNVLATSVDCATIYANPRSMTDAAATADVLAADLGGDASDYLPTLTKDTTFAYVKRKVDTSVADKVKQDLADKKLLGLYYLSDVKRIYPYGEVAGQVLGLVGTDGQGLSGLELYYNDVLSGTDGQMIMEQGADGTPIAGGMSQVTEAKNGTDVILSLDINVQEIAETNIVQGVKDHAAESGMVMITEPDTGEILAACSTPLYDPSNASSDTAGMSLRLVSDSYEPGSMFKVLTTSIGIENGIVSPSTTFTVPGKVQVGSDLVGDDDGRAETIDMDVREIMRRSSNTGAVLVGRKVGATLFWEGINRFGIGSKTGIDYPGEVAGLVTDPTSTGSDMTLSVESFGQGLAIPMVQIVRAVGAVANEGVLTTPHFLLSKGTDEVGWGSQGNAIGSEAAATEIDMMRTVVQSGTATKAQVEGYDIAGKTGTGEQAGSSGYIAGSYLSSMVGFTPSNGAKVLVYVGFNGTPQLASYSACPVFSTIMEQTVGELGIGPNAQ
ncbi:MAG: penicillin-binding protein 2 [Atopobiaceae bacterium]